MTLQPPLHCYSRGSGQWPTCCPHSCSPQCPRTPPHQHCRWPCKSMESRFILLLYSYCHFYHHYYLQASPRPQSLFLFPPSFLTLWSSLLALALKKSVTSFSIVASKWHFVLAFLDNVEMFYNHISLFKRITVNTCLIPWPSHRPWWEQNHPRCPRRTPDLHHTQPCSAYRSAKGLPASQTLKIKGAIEKILSIKRSSQKSNQGQPSIYAFFFLRLPVFFFTAFGFLRSQ